MSARRRPVGMQAAGRTMTWLLCNGLPMGPLRLLRTRGRRSGRARTAPIAVLRHGGEEWLVSPFGAVAWVHNVRANGDAVLSNGRRVREVRLVEVTGDGVPGVLRAYRRRFAAVPFVRAAFEPTGRDPVSAFARVAPRHPVFRIVGQQTTPAG